MPFPIRPFTEGMLDARPGAAEARELHRVCNEARVSAWHEARESGASILEADQEGQRAYWAKRNAKK